MFEIDRRGFVRAAGATALAVPTLRELLFSKTAQAAIGDTLTIAYNVTLPAWDPTTGPAAVNPGTMAVYKTVFDQYLDQREDLTKIPGLLTEWRWNADRTKVHFTVRDGATWHDGKPVTPEDIVWNFKRAGNPKTGNPVGFAWGSVGNFKIDGNRVTADIKRYLPTFWNRMAFLAAYVLPPHYYEKVGKAGFEKAPMGSGPYMVDAYERGSFARLKANKNYWGGAPAFDTVVFKFVTDASSRVAEIERGSSDLTFDIPYEEFDRLRKKPGLVGVSSPISDVAMIFFNDIGPIKDENVRRAAVHAVDKKVIVERLLGGYATPIDTLLAPQYIAYDPSIQTPYDPALAKRLLAKSGYSPSNPVEFTIQTTRGYKPKDYETVQAIVGMWRKVGIKANIEVYEIAKHFALRAQDKLAPAAFYNWGNSTADPESSTAYAVYGPSRHSVWDGKIVAEMIKPLLTMKDDEKRFKEYVKVNRYVAEHAIILPLWQYHQPVIHKAELDFKPHLANYILPHKIKRKR